MRYKIHSLLAFLFLTIGGNLVGQDGDNSPFSRFGIGDLVDENFMYSRSMGGLGASFNSQYQINIVNPASYASLTATAFDFGLYGKYSKLSDTEGNESSLWNGNLEYFSLAIPLTNPLNELLDREKKPRHFGMSFTLMPHSTVSYNILSEEFQEGTGNFTRNYKGTGGSYKMYWGNALRYKEYSFGINLGYLFGKINYERNVAFTDLAVPYNNAFINSYSLGGLLYNVGFQYNKILNRGDLESKKTNVAKRISIGIHGHTNTSFNTESDFLERSIQYSGSQIVSLDTLNSEFGKEGSGTLPAEIGIGATYFNGKKSAIGLNLSYSNWSSYKNTADSSEDPLLNTFKVSAGGFFRPNPKSYNNYFKRVYYRYGMFYNTDPREIDNKRLKNYGVTFGLGLPFIYQRKISHANLGLEFGLRGQGTPIKETYGKLTVSFTFNDDEWFIKRKYD